MFLREQAMRDYGRIKEGWVAQSGRAPRRFGRIKKKEQDQMLNETPQTHAQEDAQVCDALEKILALRNMAKTLNMRTTHSQTAILKAVSAGTLARIAVILKKLDEGKPTEEAIR